MNPAPAPPDLQPPWMPVGGPPQLDAGGVSPDMGVSPDVESGEMGEQGEPEGVEVEPESPAPYEAIDKSIKEDEYDRIGEDILATFNKYREYREAYVEPLWQMCYDAYHCIPPKNGSPYQSFYAIKEVFRQVQTVRSINYGKLLGQPHNFEYKAQVEGGEGKAAAAVNLTEWQLRSFGLRREQIRWLSEAPMWGNSYVYTGWKEFDTQKLQVAPVQTKDGKNYWERTTEVRKQECPDVEWIDHWTVYTHPYVEDIRQSPYVFVCRAVSPDFLKSQVQEGYLDKDVVEAVTTDEATAMPSTTGSNAPNHIREEDRRQLIGEDDSEFELMTCWTAGWCYKIINRKYLAAAYQTDRGVPIRCLTNNPQAGLHYGIGEPLLIAEDQGFLNDLTSMYADIIKITLNPIWKVHTDERKNWDQLIFQPGNKVYMDNLDHAQPLQSAVSPFPLQQSADWVRRNAQIVTGNTDEEAGQSKQRTATGIVRLQGAADVRNQYTIELWKPEFQNHYADLYDLNARFLSEAVALRVVGADGKDAFMKVQPTDFSQAVDVEILVADDMEGPEEQQKLLSLYPMIAQDPRWNFMVFQEKMARAFKLCKNPKRIIANSMQTQQDALDENTTLSSTSIIADPTPHDNHQQHIQIHQMLLATPHMVELGPQAHARMMQHIQIHQGYLQQMQAQAQQSSQVSPGQQSGATGAQGEANARSQQMFGTADRGAQQAGKSRAG